MKAGTLAEGIERIGQTKFAAAILDMTLRDGMGLPAFLRFQSKAGTVPIVVLIDRAYEDLGVEATRRGALDYLLKDEIGGALLDKVLRLALERTHTVLALRASEARYRTMFESTAAGVYQATCDDRMLTINPAFSKMLGYASEDDVLKLDFGTQICANYEDHLVWRQRARSDRRDPRARDDAATPERRSHRRHAQRAARARQSRRAAVFRRHDRGRHRIRTSRRSSGPTKRATTRSPAC